MAPDEAKAGGGPEGSERASGGEAKGYEPGVERRLHPRFSIDGCTIQHKKAGVADLRSLGEEQEPLVDISVGGLQFLTNERLHVGDAIHVRANLPKGEEPMDFAGAIVWTIWMGADADEYGVRVGVRFSEMSAETRQRLEALGRRFASEQPSA